MGKKLLSLCMALALCLSLLPATALAAAPDYQVIYVGGVKISSTGYWTTDSDGNVTAYTSGDTPTDNYIHYDVANNTLTLHNATIKESVSTDTSTFIAGAAIGVHNQNGAAELTITLEGTNTIAEVGKGIYVLANSTGGATLTITGDGSLDASASQTGIWVQNNNGNAALFIQNAKVEATGTNTAGYGVNVQSSNSSTAALTVDGGSLTASGSPGILYDSIGSGTVPNTTTLTISKSAIVDAREGGIGAGLLQDLKEVSPADDSVGIVFDGNQSTVYGDVTLQEDLTIGEDESLTIPDGASLTIGNDATLTVDGGELTGENIPTEGVVYKVTEVKLDKDSLSLEVGGTATLTATIMPDNATDQNVTWSSDNQNVATVDQNGKVTAVGEGTATITATAADGSGANASCTVTVSRYSSGGGSSSSSTSLSDRAIDDIQDARPGDTVEITLRPGRTTLEREVFEELAGQDITLEIDAGDGVLWTVNGLDIPEDTRLHDLDLDVDLGDSGIPATVLNAVTGEIGTVQLSLAHDGEFGFTMTLSAPLGRDNADYWANLYWYNERTEELEFQQAARIAKDGTAEFALDHASDYAIVIDDRSHEPVDLPFTDVPEGYWAYGAIQYVYGEGLMAGTSGSTFSPEGTTTRGQIVTILWRLSGSPVVNYAMDYNDVAEGSYYAEAIRWATSEGIAGGYGGGVFGPDDPITREQLAVMLHRYAQHEGCDVSIGEDTNILSYADAFTVSEYAVSALQWACGAGIISGTGDGSTLTPQGGATRAQAATVLMRFCEHYQ